MSFPSRRLLRPIAVAGVACLALTACGSGDDDPGADPGEPTSSSSEPGGTGSSATSEPPSDAPSSTEGSTDPGGSTEEPLVYWAADQAPGTRLVAEPAELTAQAGSEEALIEAAQLVTAGEATDPDYRSLFTRGASVGSVTAEGDALRVEVDGRGWTRRPTGMSAAEARLAGQQLVYSLQSVAGERLPVEVVDADGDAVPLFGRPTDGGLTAARPLSVLGFVNVLAPVDGEEVTGGSLEVRGLQSSFEGTVPWEVRDDDGRRVAQGSAQGTFDPRRLAPFRTTVDLDGLEPGTYTFIARTDDPTGGAEGPGPSEDTKTFRVG